MPPHSSAQQAYLQAHQQACDLLVHIEELLQGLPAPDVGGCPAESIQVGLASEVVRKLTSVVRLLEGTEK